MRGILLLFLLLSSALCVASAQIRVSGADEMFNATLYGVSIGTKQVPVPFVFSFNDNGKANQSLEKVQVPTSPAALGREFTFNEASSDILTLESVSIPTGPQALMQIFVLHEFVKDSKDLAYPAALVNDTTPPRIADVESDDVKVNRARINWTTDEFSDSLVKYGLSSLDHGTSARDVLYTMNHSVSLFDLSPGTRYYFAVNSTDRSGNSAESQEYEFKTSSA